MKLLALVLTLICMAVPAEAGPVAAAFAWVAGAVGSALAAGGLAAIAMNIALSVGASLLSMALSSMLSDKPKVKVKFEKALGDDVPLTFIVGKFATAGTIKYIGSWGKNTRYITEVIEISSVPISGLDGAWANDERADIRWDEPVNYSGDFMGYPVKNFSESPRGSDRRHRCWIKLIDGTQTVADPFLRARFGGDSDYPWTVDHIGAGKAYIVMTYYYDPESMTAVPEMLFEPTPLPMYDLRKDSTAGGLGSHRWGDRSTYEPSMNNAVVAYNIARGIYFGDEWVFGGKNRPAWSLPAAEWMAAANACDASVALTEGGTEPAFRCGAEVTVDMAPLDVIEEIGRAANMRFAEIGGRLKPVVGLPGSAVLAITDDDILLTENQSMAPFRPLSDTYNAIMATYPEKDEKWANKDAPEYISEEATEEDGGAYYPASVAYGAAPFRNQVQRLQRAQIEDYRRGITHEFCLPPEAYGLEPVIDAISWTSRRNGYTNKIFVVESVTKMPGMIIQLNLREAEPGDFDWSPAMQQPVEITVPVNPIPFTQVITGFTVTPFTVLDQDGVARKPAIKVSCDGDEVGVTHIHIQVRMAGSEVVRVDVEVPFAEPYEWIITDVLPNTGYEVQAELISSITPIREWTGWTPVVTDDIRMGPKDLDYSEITAGVVSDLNDLEGWIEGELLDVNEQLIAVGEEVDGFSASGLFRVMAEATPSGALSRIGLKAKADGTEADSLREAAMYLEAVAGDKSRVVFIADYFAILNDVGVPVLPFYVSGGVVYMQDVQITGDLIVNDAVTRTSFTELISGTVTVTSAHTYLSPLPIVFGSAELTPIPYGGSARNRLVFRVSGIAEPSTSGAAQLTIGIWGSNDGTSWSQLSGSELRRDIRWPSNSQGRSIPFSWDLDDRYGTADSYTFFKVFAYGMTGSEKCYIDRCKMVVQQFNK